MSTQQGSDVEKIIEECGNCIHIQFRTTQVLRENLVKIIQACGYTINGFSVSEIVRAFLQWQLETACEHMKPVHIREKIQEYLAKKPKRGRPKIAGSWR